MELEGHCQCAMALFGFGMALSKFATACAGCFRAGKSDGMTAAAGFSQCSFSAKDPAKFEFGGFRFTLTAWIAKTSAK